MRKSIITHPLRFTARNDYALLLETTAVHGGVDMGKASTDKEQKLIN